MVALFTFLLGWWIALFSQSAAAATGQSEPGYTYDWNSRLGLPASTTTEPSPSAEHDRSTRHAVRCSSAAASVCLGNSTASPVYGYDHLAPFVQIGPVAGVTEEGARVAEGCSVVTAGGGVAAKTGAKTCSFAGATVVLMADGSRKPIDEVVVGDRVIATDPETGEQVAKKVEHVFVHNDTLIDLVVDGEVVITTEDHPFWSVTDQRFERADELSHGEKVLGADGTVITVSGLELGTAREALAYNLTVEGIHTYHVGETEVLVHNTCGINPEPFERQLENGITRSYGKFRPARTEGPTAGARYVRERGGPGGPRGWMESYYENGTVRQVHPKGGDYPHYLFDRSGNYMGAW